ncbi:MAG: hypothetical protein V1742_12550, partial [Pseudomonadota bacterium]
DSIVGMEFLIGKFMMAQQLPDSEPIKPLAVQFHKDWEAMYKKPIDPVGFLGQMELMIAVDALKRAKTTDGPKLREAIENTKDLITGYSVITMSPDNHVGLANVSVIAKYLGNDKWEAVKY